MRLRPLRCGTSPRMLKRRRPAPEGPVLVGPPTRPLSASGPLTCRLRRADQQDCPARSVKRRGGHEALLAGCSRDSTRGDCRCVTRSELNSSSRSPPWSIAPTPPSGRAEPPGRPDPCGFHQDRRGRLRDQGRRTGGAGPRLGRSILRREMSWLFHRCRSRHQRLGTALDQAELHDSAGRLGAEATVDLVRIVDVHVDGGETRARTAAGLSIERGRARSNAAA